MNAATCCLLAAALILPSLAPRRRRRHRPRPTPSPRRPRRRSACRRRQAIGGADRAQRAGAQAGRRQAHRSTASRRRPPCSPAVRRAARATCSRRAGRHLATGSFAKDPPNATVSAFAKDGSKVTDAVVVLRAPKLDRRASSPSTSRCWKAASAMPTGRPRCSSTRSGSASARAASAIYGQSQTTGGDDARRSATATTPAPSRGWSNPSPTGPLRAAPRTYGYRGRRAAAARLDPRISSATTRRPAAPRRCCPATEAAMTAIRFCRPRRSGPSLCRLLPAVAQTAAPGARPRPSARRSSRRSCRR